MKNSGILDTVGSPAEKVSSVLIVVDVQRDFFSPEGTLYVNGSEELPARIAAVAHSYDAVIFTLDWHPANHCSFVGNGGMWPPHCVAYTHGAGLADDFLPILAGGPGRFQLHLKATETDKEQYGGFEILEGKTGEWLTNASKIGVCGIAGDYCVLETIANLLKFIPSEKFAVLTDCIRSIDDGSKLSEFMEKNNLAQE